MAHSTLKTLLSAVLLTVIVAVGIGRFHHHCCHGDICFKWASLFMEPRHHNHVHHCDDRNGCGIETLDNITTVGRYSIEKEICFSVGVMPCAITVAPPSRFEITLISAPMEIADFHVVSIAFTRRGPPQA